MSNLLTPWPGTSFGRLSDNNEAMRLLRENNAMLKQIIQLLASQDGASESVRDFFINVMANWAADDLAQR